MHPTVQDTTRDAVVVIPGIMGSELIDIATGKVLWGVANPQWYVSAWTTGRALEALHFTEAELSGQAKRIKATRLLRTAAFAPILRGVEPYRDLIAGVRRVVAHPDAVLEFAYDWRQPVDTLARELGSAATAHLERWRHHPDGSADARLVLVAHSMGGLVGQHFISLQGGGELVRSIVTLGTPFYGSVKAAYILSTGDGAPLPFPRRRLRAMAVTLPSIYDLLPAYRCVVESNGSRHLTEADIATIGADAGLAKRSLDIRSQVTSANLNDIYSVVGVGQPTMQSIQLNNGTVNPCFYICESNDRSDATRVDRRGDSTVYRDAAAMLASGVMYLPQSHSSLAKSPEAIAVVQAVITRRPLGPPLGTGVDDDTAGVDIPDIAIVGEPLTVAIENADIAAVSCRVYDVSTGEIEAIPKVTARSGDLTTDITLTKPGIFKVEVKTSSYSPITQLVLAIQDGDRGGGC